MKIARNLSILIISFICLNLFSSALFATEASDSQLQITQALKHSPIKNIMSMREYLLEKGQQVSFDNMVKLVTLEDGTKAVFKPVPADDLGDSCVEVAAFKASQLLGFVEVPPTVIRKINGEIGSLQLYVEPALDLLQPGVYEKVLKNVSQDELANLKLFYFVLGQWDTGPQNLIARKESAEDPKRMHLVAIDNSGIRNRQHVRYGELPFVRICYSDALNTDDWHLPFPFQQAKRIDNPSFEKLQMLFGKTIPEKVLKNLSKYTGLGPLPYVIYKNGLWIQFLHGSDDTFVISHTHIYPRKTMEILKKLNNKDLDTIFSEAKGSDFLTKDYLEDILERRDQVIKAYEQTK